MNDLQCESAILDSLDQQIAVMDLAGCIVYVNRAWCHFACSNGLSSDYPWIGVNYLQVLTTSALEDDSARAVLEAGFRGVLGGTLAHFEYEYPCHSPTEQRWFRMRLVPLHGVPGHFVVSHLNITSRKLAEHNLQRANRALEQLAATDRLTLLANRYRLDEALENELYRAGRYGTAFSVILMDVDHFKRVNDRFGHLIGDQVLVDLADVLRYHVRESDIAGRWGGEEFLILLPLCDLDAAAQMAEKLRAEIERHAFSDRFAWGSQTCSFGVCMYAPGDTEATLIARADAALYRAKHAGRNCVVVHAAPPVADLVAKDL